jgi:hypothetical protein
MELEKPRWCTWRQVVGPSLTYDQLHCAGLSDRDPATQESFYMNMEARSRAALAAWRQAGGLAQATQPPAGALAVPTA